MSIDLTEVKLDKIYMSESTLELLAENLKSFRENKGLTLDDLEDLSGISRDHIGRLERGEQSNPRRKTINALAKALGVTTQDLEYGPRFKAQIDENGIRYLERHKGEKAPSNTIPIIGISSAGKSNITWDDQGYPVGHGFEYIDRPSFLKNEKHAFGAKISGDSMTPRVRPGDKIIVAPNKQIVSGDDILVRLKNDEVYIKEVKFQGSMVILMSVNPAYQPMFVKKSEIKFMYKVALILPK